jgi:hypothetical protein
MGSTTQPEYLLPYHIVVMNIELILINTVVRDRLWKSNYIRKSDTVCDPELVWLTS